MEQSTINVRVDKELKKEFEDFCNDTGMSISVAINIFLKTVVREQRIPFIIERDTFYSKANTEYLEKIAKEMDDGKGIVHDLIED